jgi:hypothetical protein
MSLVEATFKESLNRVATNSTEGNMAKSKGLTVYMAIRITTIEKVMLSANRKSSKKGGSGMIITIKMATTPTAMKESLLLPKNVRRKVASVAEAKKILLTSA